MKVSDMAVQRAQDLWLHTLEQLRRPLAPVTWAEVVAFRRQQADLSPEAVMERMVTEWAAGRLLCMYNVLIPIDASEAIFHYYVGSFIAGLGSQVPEGQQDMLATLTLFLQRASQAASYLMSIDFSPDFEVQRAKVERFRARVRDVVS